MKILGLVGSYRKLGNTEILVKEALLAAQRLGAEVDLMRLTDLKIEPCKGCMACLFKGEECRIQDDWIKFRNRILESDAVVLGAPTYLLGPAGIIKMITDRNIAFLGRVSENKGKPSAVIGVSGIKEWEPFSLPMLNIFMLSCGLKVVDQVMFYAQGPGEILLDESAMQRAGKVGANLVQALRGLNMNIYYGESGVCPVCHQNLFQIKNGELECALCQVKAKIKIVDENMTLVFDRNSLKENRWSEEALSKNFFSAVLPSGQRFLREKDEIMKRVKKYRNFPPNTT
jgi:multimeric flavodoxin WrbA